METQWLQAFNQNIEALSHSRTLALSHSSSRKCSGLGEQDHRMCPSPSIIWAIWIGRAEAVCEAEGWVFLRTIQFQIVRQFQTATLVGLQSWQNGISKKHRVNRNSLTNSHSLAMSLSRNSLSRSWSRNSLSSASATARYYYSFEKQFQTATWTVSNGNLAILGRPNQSPSTSPRKLRCSPWGRPHSTQLIQLRTHAWQIE